MLKTSKESNTIYIDDGGSSYPFKADDITWQVVDTLLYVRDYQLSMSFYLSTKKEIQDIVSQLQELSE